MSSVFSPKNKLEEDRRRLQWQLLDDTEDLEGHTPKTENLLPNLSLTSCEAFNRIDAFTRELNIEKVWKTPEFVIVGTKGSGKTTLLESLIGHPILEVPTQRPIFWSMVNSLHCEEPRVTIKADTFLKNEEFMTDEVVELSNLGEALEERNIQTDKPIYIKYEYKYCWDATFIDTPGIFENEDGNISREQVVVQLAQPSNRVILFVEEAQDWSNTMMLQFSKKIDPKLSRSIFVFTKFQYHLKDFSTARELNLFLSGRPPPRVKSFFVSMISSKVKNQFQDPDQFKLKIEQATQRDIDYMESLKVDMSSKIFGIPSLKRTLLEMMWTQYHNCIPNVLKHLRVSKKERLDNLQFVQKQIATLDKNQLRSVAANYVTNFGQIAKDILLGSVEIGNLSSLGELLEEEKRIVGDWYDAYGNIIRFDPQEWNIPKRDSKLYGGQQFERLLEEFKIVAQRIANNQTLVEEVITACGMKGLNTVSGHIRGASDISQKKCREIFEPLVEHLFDRATYIIKRISHIVPIVMDAKSRGMKNPNEIKTIKVNDHKPFQFYVEDIFGEFVEKLVADCMKKCMDEIKSVQILYWDSEAKRKFGNQVNEGKIGNSDLVITLAKELYEDHRERISHNIVLTCYEHLIVKLAETMPSAIHSKSVNVSDEQLSQMFDLESSFKKLKENENRLQELVEKDDEPEFLKASSNFKL